MLYPQNGGRVVALVFVTSLHPIYYNMQDVQKYHTLCENDGAAPLKIRPFGAIQIRACLLLLFYYYYYQSYIFWLVAWHSGRTSVSGRRTFPVLHSTCS